MPRVYLYWFLTLLLGAYSGMALGDAPQTQWVNVHSSVLLTTGAAPDKGVTGRGLPDSPEAWLARMIEASRNGQAFRHPEAFTEWLEAISEPRAMTALATVTRSGASARTLGGQIDPATVRNWDEFTDPGLYLRRLLAGLDAHIYSAIYDCLTNPDKAIFQVSAVAGDRDAPSMPAQGGQWLRLPVSPTKMPTSGPAFSQRY